jgi:hypothetical protein
VQSLYNVDSFTHQCSEQSHGGDHNEQEGREGEIFSENLEVGDDLLVAEVIELFSRYGLLHSCVVIVL